MIRVLHVDFRLTMGGVATCNYNILKRLDRKKWAFDFLIEKGEEQFFDKKFEALGSRLLRCESPRNPIAFGRSFSKLIDEFGPYQIIHSHPYAYSGLVVMLAAWKSIPARIVHSRNDHRHVDWRQKPLYHYIMRKLISHYATGGIAVSSGAAEALFPQEWKADSRWTVLRSGIDFEPFEKPINAANIRHEIGLSDDGLVIGHIGRFVKQKNHLFILDILDQIRIKIPSVTLLLVGDGPLVPMVREQLEQRGLSQSAILLEVRNDVSALLKGAIDVLLFPSVHEGLPQVVVQAQAAGTPVVASSNVTREAILYDGGIDFVPLEASISEWVEAVIKSARRPRKASSEALMLAKHSKFNIDAHVAQILKFYNRSLRDAGFTDQVQRLS